MSELLQMWAMVEVLGFVCLPLTITVFHNLPDRGWAFSKAIGTAVLAFCVWLPLMCLSVLPFSQFFITGIFLLLLAGNIIGFLKVRQTIAKVVRVNVPYILISEAVFAGMMFLLGWIRSFVPDIRSFEMFMGDHAQSPFPSQRYVVRRLPHQLLLLCSLYCRDPGEIARTEPFDCL